MKRSGRPASKKKSSSQKSSRNTPKAHGLRPLREDLVLQASLEAYALVRHEGRLSDRALDFTLRRKAHLYSTERRAVFASGTV